MQSSLDWGLQSAMLIMFALAVTMIGLAVWLRLAVRYGSIGMAYGEAIIGRRLHCHPGLKAIENRRNQRLDRSTQPLSEFLPYLHEPFATPVRITHYRTLSFRRCPDSRGARRLPHGR